LTSYFQTTNYLSGFKIRVLKITFLNISAAPITCDVFLDFYCDALDIVLMPRRRGKIKSLIVYLIVQWSDAVKVLFFCIKVKKYIIGEIVIRSISRFLIYNLLFYNLRSTNFKCFMAVLWRSSSPLNSMLKSHFLDPFVATNHGEIHIYM